MEKVLNVFLCVNNLWSSVTIKKDWPTFLLNISCQEMLLPKVGQI